MTTALATPGMPPRPFIDPVMPPEMLPGIPNDCLPIIFYFLNALELLRVKKTARRFSLYVSDVLKVEAWPEWKLLGDSRVNFWRIYAVPVTRGIDIYRHIASELEDYLLIPAAMTRSRWILRLPGLYVANIRHRTYATLSELAVGLLRSICRVDTGLEFTWECPKDCLCRWCRWIEQGLLLDDWTLENQRDDMGNSATDMHFDCAFGILRDFEKLPLHIRLPLVHAWAMSPSTDMIPVVYDGDELPVTVGVMEIYMIVQDIPW
ncbi:MAG: hypothetical protein GY703_09090 [Gammaproteobacteria bacterium]|nr:hypothetical protein [Gammaproteobacteria bacterium]